MAFQNIDQKTLGKIIQIKFTDGIYNQINSTHKDFELVQGMKVSDTGARSLRFFHQTSLGPAGVQYRNPGVRAAFARAQDPGASEYEAVLKEISSTIELEYNIFERALATPEKYGDYLEMQISSKEAATKRRLCFDLYGDGTGVVGTVASAAVSSGKLNFTLSSANAARGSVAFFEIDDLLVLKAADGTASDLDTNLATEPVYWKVIDKDREARTVLLQGLDSNYAAVTIASISVQPTAGDVFYRYGQPTIPDLTSISDYGTVSEVITGLESLTANDARAVHGITMQGVQAGSRVSASGNAIDVSYIEKALNKAKLAVGENRYSYKMMIMAPEVHSAFAESKEGDRRFMTLKDDARGMMKFGYQHRNDFLEAYASDFVPLNRVYMLPELKTGQKVLQFHGTEFAPVKAPNGDEFHLLPASGGAGYQDVIAHYMKSRGVIINNHSAAIAVLENFTY